VDLVVAGTGDNLMAADIEKRIESLSRNRLGPSTSRMGRPDLLAR